MLGGVGANRGVNNRSGRKDVKKAKSKSLGFLSDSDMEQLEQDLEDLQDELRETF